MKKIIIFILLFLTINIFSLELNFNHLEFLRDTFKIGEKEYIGYWIYADKYGNRYIHKPAPGEGVTCVDDVARVAILYTDLYKLEKKDFYYTRAKEALEFVLAMQDYDGDFYNFVFEDGSINKLGVTSKKSASWWAARAFWAICNAINIFPDEELNILLIKSASKVKKILLSNLNSENLLNNSTDVTSLLLLGLSKYFIYSNDPNDLEYIIKLSDSILNYQVKDGPYYGTYNEGNKNQFLWHTWGSRQGEALIEAYKITNDKKYLDSVIKYVNFYDLLLSIGPVYEIKNFIIKYPYLSYGLETIISTLSNLYLVTNNENYAIKAFLFGSFYSGNNHLNFPMLGYNGEGFDGMHSVYVNQNAGAESTISALIALTRLKSLPKEYEKFYYSKTIGGNQAILMEAEKMDTGIYYFELDNSGNIQIKTNEKIALKTMIEFSGEYYIHLIGNIPESEIKIYSGKEKIVSNRNFIPIKLEKGKLTISITPQNNRTLYLDQILLIPQKYTYIIKLDNEFIELTNDTINKINYKYNTNSNDYSNLSLKTYNIDNYSILDLDNVFNNDGITSFSNRREGNFDNPDGVFGAKYPSEEIIKELSNNFIKYNDIPFKIKIDGNDNLVCAGQRLEINNTKGQKLFILGSSEHGNYQEKILIEYIDGEIQEELLSFSDWCQSPIYGENIVIDTIYRYNGLGIKENLNPKIYLNTFDLKNKELKNIFLPKKPTMHIFAITIK
jgi:hypothetical protein